MQRLYLQDFGVWTIYFFFPLPCLPLSHSHKMQTTASSKSDTILFLWVTEWWSSANSFIQRWNWKEKKCSLGRRCFWNDLISGELWEMIWSTCASEGAGRLNIEHVHRIVCWSGKQPGLRQGEFFIAHIFTALISHVMAVWFTTMHSRSSAKGLRHSYTSHPLAAQLREFYKPLYVCEVGGYWRREKTPGTTIIAGCGGQRTKEAAPRRGIVMLFIIQPHFPDHQAAD